ncbi:unnamed protein product [Allacma fusca]|uniref:Uncharacterized protein n=1 Tax=Allacma fusca TaxID=39272 RepID=A0A8J2PAT2_9HEXA|nr:unnamed protein product [Allacma fusca]
MRAYFVFLFTKFVNSSQLLEFAKSTPLFLQVYFAVSEDNSIDIFVRGVLIQKLIKIITFDANEAQGENQELITRKKYSDYEGAPFIAMVGPTGTRAMNVFRETGNWIDWSSPIIYELTQVFNASLELATVYTLPKKGRDKDGEWDDYTKPLLEGTSAISSYITPSVESNHALILTRSTHNELVVFITALPKRITVSSLLQLLRPLNTNVWTGIILSIALIFSVLETMIYLKRRRVLMERIKVIFLMPQRRAWFEDLNAIEKEIPKHIRTLTLYAILQPIIDQSGLTSKTLRTNIQGFWTRLVIGSWFLMLIVVMCAYKSKLIDRIVLPYYTQPPTTFQELAESNYGIGVVFWTGVIEVYFKALNSSVSRSVLQRATEYNFFDDDCYVSIFEGDKACIGFKGLFNRIGMRYMVDIEKQKMFVISKEVLFPVYTSMGLSRYYPELNGRL